MDSRGYSKSAWVLPLAAAFLSLLFAGGAAAQTMPPGMTMVSGLYVNADAGVEIEFPVGWEGVAIETDKALIVTTTMGETSEKAILLMISDKTEVENPTDPNEFSQETEMECGTPAVASRTVAGKSGQEVTVECTSDEGVTSKIKMVIANTEEEWIAVMYMAPTAEFAADEAKFDATVQSLQVEGAIDSEGMGGIPDGDGGVSIGLTAVTRTVVIADANVDVNIRTNSTIGQLELDEENNSVSFTVDGQTGTAGTTEISIGKMLEGPYTVTIDGQATTNFEVANEGSVDAVMTISYTHSEHDVVVTGTSVVPEFPVAVIGVIAAIIGIVAIVGRTRLVSGYRQT
jgi:hypothetical protein